MIEIKKSTVYSKNLFKESIVSPFLYTIQKQDYKMKKLASQEKKHGDITAPQKNMETSQFPTKKSWRHYSFPERIMETWSYHGANMGSTWVLMGSLHGDMEPSWGQHGANMGSTWVLMGS